MQIRNLGRTGLKVSRLCLGTMTFGWSADERESFNIMDAAVAAGITFFDTADIYSSWIGDNVGGESETIIGKWLKGKDRRDVIIATKVRGRMWQGANGEGLSRVHIIQACEDSLRRLQTDTIDLYQSHWPDDDTPLEETLAAFDYLVQSGKVRYIGCSNFPAWLLMKSAWVADVKQLVRYDCIQPHYSLFNRAEYEKELAAACADLGVGVIPYSPLAAGFATGKYSRENKNAETSRANSGLIKRLLANDKAFDALDVLQAIAAEHEVPMGQIALAWLLAQPTVTSPIIGARKVEQLEEALGAVEIRLSDEQMGRLNAMTEGF